MSPKTASALAAAGLAPHPWALADAPADLLAAFADDAKAERHERHVHFHLCRKLTADLKAIRRGLRSVAK